MVFPTPSDRARDAARAYDLARARGDDRLRRAAINVTMSSSIAGGNEFGMTIGGSTHPLTVAPITVATFTTAPQTLTAQAVWGVNAGGSPVDSSYFGDVILVTLAITAASA